MLCKKCGVDNTIDAKFCSQCGYDLKNNSNNFESEGFKNKSEFDEQFIKAYMGRKADDIYDSVKNNGINLWALLFGLLYYSYRKMYLILFISILTSILIAIFIPNISWFVGNFIGLIFCPLYKWDITRKLRKIKAENPGASEDKLIEIAQSKGGTSLLSALLLGTIYILLLFM